MVNTKDTKILVVDDEPDIVEFLTYNLKKEGFNIYSATNGKDALKIVSKKKRHFLFVHLKFFRLD